MALVVDLSGSMGEHGRIDEVRRGVAVLSEHLSPTDQVALVGFDQDARVLVPMGPPTSMIDAMLEAAEPEGATDIHRGLLAGATTLSRVEGRRQLILVRDGPSNVGVLDPDALKRAIQVLEAEGLEVVLLTPAQFTSWAEVSLV